MSRFHQLMIGQERGSLYWYMSLLAMSAGMVLTMSGVFGWPPLPIWQYLSGRAS